MRFKKQTGNYSYSSLNLGSKAERNWLLIYFLLISYHRCTACKYHIALCVKPYGFLATKQLPSASYSLLVTTRRTRQGNGWYIYAADVCLPVQKSTEYVQCAAPVPSLRDRYTASRVHHTACMTETIDSRQR